MRTQQVLLVAGDAEPGAGPDRKRYVITEAGATEFETWPCQPTEPEPHLRTVLFAKARPCWLLMLAEVSDR